MAKQANAPTQSGKFQQTARELGCDESEERFNAALRQIAKQKPKPKAPKSQPTKKRRAR